MSCGMYDGSCNDCVLYMDTCDGDDEELEKEESELRQFHLMNPEKPKDL